MHECTDSIMTSGFCIHAEHSAFLHSCICAFLEAYLDALAAATELLSMKRIWCGAFCMITELVRVPVAEEADARIRERRSRQ